MKKIAVFFEQAGAYDYPFEERRYLVSHCQLAAEIGALGASYRVTRSHATYCGNGRFSKSWQFQDGRVVDSGPMQADVIFDKGRFAADDFDPVFNCREINRICTDKWETYCRFQALSPLTVLARTETEYHLALARIPGDLKVVKPLDSLQGQGVFICREEELQSPPIALPAIVQEFLVTENGIPGLAQGVHDFRITLLNGEVIYALVRIPPPGQLVAAVARGAEMHVIERDAIPKAFMDIARDVDGALARCGARLISVDMALTPDGARLIELNSRVALRENEIHPAFWEMKCKLARVLVGLT